MVLRCWVRDIRFKMNHIRRVKIIIDKSKHISNVELMIKKKKNKVGIKKMRYFWPLPVDFRPIPVLSFSNLETIPPHTYNGMFVKPLIISWGLETLVAFTSHHHNQIWSYQFLFMRVRGVRSSALVLTLLIWLISSISIEVAFFVCVLYISIYCMVYTRYSIKKYPKWIKNRIIFMLRAQSTVHSSSLKWTQYAVVCTFLNW